MDNSLAKVAQDLTANPRIQNVAEIMIRIEEEITMVKSGQLKAAEGNVAMRGRGLQLKVVEMWLSACRMMPKMGVDIPRVFATQLEESKPAPAPVVVPQPKKKTRRIA